MGAVNGPAVTAAVLDEWCGLLSIGTPDPEADFFALGGNSLLAMRLIERVEQRLSIVFPIEALFLDGRLRTVLDACLVAAGEAGTV